MGYKEEIFDRTEKRGLKDQKELLDWLRRDKNDNIVREKTSSLVRVSTEVDGMFFEKNSEEVLKIADRFDFSELKQTKYIHTKSQEYLENVAYNTAQSRRRELRDELDINGLNKLKDNIKGLKDESEIINLIDRDIERLLIKHGR